VDLDDPHCSSPTDGREGPNPGCGLGAELGIVCVLLARLRGRRARRPDEAALRES